MTIINILVILKSSKLKKTSYEKFGAPKGASYIYGVKIIKVMYLDIEVQADRYEVEQELLQEMAKEEFSKKHQPRQMNERERVSLKVFNEQLENSFKK